MCVWEVGERKSEREREKSHNCTMNSPLDLLMGNEEKDNPRLLSGDNTIHTRKKSALICNFL